VAQPVLPLSDPAELRYAHERMTLERCLATLDEPGAPGTGGPATEPQARVAREAWRCILALEPRPLLPCVGFTDEGVLYLSWNYPHFGASVHVQPDGLIDWYFKDDKTGLLEGTKTEPVAALPPLFFSLTCRMRRP